MIMKVKDGKESNTAAEFKSQKAAKEGQPVFVEAPNPHSYTTSTYCILNQTGGEDTRRVFKRFAETPDPSPPSILYRKWPTPVAAGVELANPAHIH